MPESAPSMLPPETRIPTESSLKNPISLPGTVLLFGLLFKIKKTDEQVFFLLIRFLFLYDTIPAVKACRKIGDSILLRIDLIDNQSH